MLNFGDSYLAVYEVTLRLLVVYAGGGFTKGLLDPN